MQEHRHDENQSHPPGLPSARDDRFDERSSRDRGDVERWYGEGGSQTTTAPPADEEKPAERKRGSRQKPNRVK
jgi:hypothetical protein